MFTFLLLFLGEARRGKVRQGEAREWSGGGRNEMIKWTLVKEERFLEFCFHDATWMRSARR